jgi:hypothetical protein
MCDISRNRIQIRPLHFQICSSPFMVEHNNTTIHTLQVLVQELKNERIFFGVKYDFIRLQV